MTAPHLFPLQPKIVTASTAPPLTATAPSAASQAEAENIAIAVTKYLGKRPTRRSAPFSCAWALRLHQEMFGLVWDWAGVPCWQLPPEQGSSFSPLQAVLQKRAVEKLFVDISTRAPDEKKLKEEASDLYCRALALRPFIDGNKRWARLLEAIFIKQHAG